MDNQNKSSVLQWLMPTAVMMVVVIIMLVSFTHKANKEAESTVSKTLISNVETYGSGLLHELEKIDSVGLPVSALLAKRGRKMQPGWRNCFRLSRKARA